MSSAVIYVDRLTCSVDQCDRDAWGLGLCNMHYQRQRRSGDPNGVGVLSGVDHGSWAGDDIGYFGLHIRLGRLRGPASAHICVHCDQPATGWAYDHGDANPKWENRLVYSTDPDRYIPLCGSHHRLFDGVRNRKLSNDQVAEIRQAALGGATHRTLAARYGVDHTTIGNVVRHRTYCDVS
jgi:hypothetical protein